MEGNGQEKSNDTSQAEEYTPADAADDFIDMISDLAKTDIKSEFNELVDGDGNNENPQTAREKVVADGPVQDSENHQNSGAGDQKDDNIQNTQQDKQSSHEPNPNGKGGSEDYTPSDAVEDFGDVLSGVIDDGSGGSDGEKGEKTAAEQGSKADDTGITTQSKQNTDGFDDENYKDGALGTADTAKGSITTEDLRAAFAVFDTSADGLLDRNELRSLLDGSDIDIGTVDEVLDAADINKDGKLNIDELAKYLTQEFT